MPMRTLLLLVTAAALAVGCSGERVAAPEAAPGGPAYWESNVVDPSRPPPGTHFENWPSLDGGVPPEPRRERFLWEDSPPSQMPAGAVVPSSVDAGADAADASPTD